MNVKIYKYLFHRVEYPFARGYRIEPFSLPDWIYITITKDKDNKYLTVYSKIHVNKKVQINPIYSSDFTDIEIIKDLSSKIYNRFIA